MPVRAALPGLLKHQIMLTVNNEHESAVMTLWTYRAVHPIPTGRLAYERTQIEDWVHNWWAHIVVPQVVATGVKTWDFGTTPPTKLGRWHFSPPRPGDNAATRTCPFSTQAVMALRTQPVGSNFRDRFNGRINHVGIAATTGDSLSALLRADLVTFYTNLLDRLKLSANVETGAWSVVSFFDQGAPRVVPLVRTVDHILCRTQAGTQRRRMRKVGPYAVGA